MNSSHQYITIMRDSHAIYVLLAVHWTRAVPIHRHQGVLRAKPRANTYYAVSAAP